MRTLLAKLLATFAHRGQVRKIEGEPYIKHPRRVAAAARLDPGLTPAERRLAERAALLHDVLEDTNVPRWVLVLVAGTRAAGLVDELTDVYTHEAYPELNRAKRKSMEAERLGRASDLAKHIKLLDLVDNLGSYATPEGYEHSEGFVEVFADEAEYLLDHIGHVCPWKAAHVRHLIYAARRIASENRRAE